MRTSTLFTVLAALLTSSTLTTAKVLPCLKDDEPGGPDVFDCNTICNSFRDPNEFAVCFGIFEGDPPFAFCCCRDWADEEFCSERACGGPDDDNYFVRNSTLTNLRAVGKKQTAARRGRLARREDDDAPQECIDWMYDGILPDD